MAPARLWLRHPAPLLLEPLQVAHRGAPLGLGQLLKLRSLTPGGTKPQTPLWSLKPRPANILLIRERALSAPCLLQRALSRAYRRHWKLPDGSSWLEVYLSAKTDQLVGRLMTKINFLKSRNLVVALSSCLALGPNGVSDALKCAMGLARLKASVRSS